VPRGFVDLSRYAAAPLGEGGRDLRGDMSPKRAVAKLMIGLRPTEVATRCANGFMKSSSASAPLLPLKSGSRFCNEGHHASIRSCVFKSLS